MEVNIKTKRRSLGWSVGKLETALSASSLSDPNSCQTAMQETLVLLMSNNEASYPYCLSPVLLLCKGK
jgi:hypothetical protein